MIRLPAADPAAEALLQGLHQQELAAIRNGDRAGMVVARLLWAEAYLRSYGIEPDTLPRLSGACMQLFPADVSNSPRWRTYVERRPLVRVVSRHKRTHKVCPGYKAHWLEEKLECGHTLTAFVPWMGELPPMRRRCPECPPVASVTQGAQQNGGVR